MRIRNFLLIHSSRSVRAMITRHILSEFSDVEIAESDTGRDAAFQLGIKSFNLLISESSLADMHITDLRREMATYPKNNDTEIIVLAGGDSADELDSLAQAGFKNIVTVPFDPQKIFEIINKICDPRRWRQAERFHIPHSKVIINVWGMEAEANLVNISRGGVLLEVSGNRSELLLQNNPRLTLKIKAPHGYYDIKNLSSKVIQLNVTEWNDSYKPIVMRVAYTFLDLAPPAAAELEQVLQLAKENHQYADET